ncbi:hypothetical protein N7490_008947 [Penicillium lividum]|nr:hypothetical protein N7490_008947 [Penicillium lividum]
MLDFVDDASRREKCFTTITQLPASVDPKQVASKKSPFSAILNHPFVHTVETILPKDAYDSIQASLDATLQNPQYARVFMYPSNILENDFFNTYIKTGNILMISEGRAGLDTVFTLRDGLLRIEAGKEIYERSGLSGKPIRSGGRKHNKERFDAKPVQKHSPHWFNCAPLRNSLGRTVIPPLSGLVAKDTPEVELQEACGSFSEWIALVQMRSPRVSAGDDVDPYLSRYNVPDLDKASTSELISLKWHGLISPKWILHLFSSLLSQTTNFNSSAWFILSASALGKQAVEGRDGYTIAAAPNICSEQAGEAGATDRRHAICWEFVGATTTES